MSGTTPRWDGDVRGYGIADGRWIRPSVERLLEALSQPDWVAEAADDHLLPHVRRACGADSSPWRIGESNLRDDGVYEVELTWDGPSPGLRRLRADVFALLGEIAEGSTFIQQVVADGAIEFHVTTGLLTGDTQFAGHGHLIRLRITGSSIPRLLAALT
jgi:hypothetical protein